MKSKILILLSFILTLALMLASCGGTPTTECTEHIDADGDGICDTAGCGTAVEKKPDVNSDMFNESGELYLFKNGSPTFQFVLGSDSLSVHRGTVEDLAEAINKINNLKGDDEKIKTVAQG